MIDKLSTDNSVLPCLITQGLLFPLSLLLNFEERLGIYWVTKIMILEIFSLSLNDILISLMLTHMDIVMM